MEKTEKIWILTVVVILGLFLSTLVYGINIGINTPYETELCTPEFLKGFIPGVDKVEEGVYVVRIVAKQFFFTPTNITLKNPKLIVFEIISDDVIHGFQIVNTNVNVMVFPGYLTRVKWSPPSDFEGKFLIVCNEYCGTYHSTMYAYLTIER